MCQGTRGCERLHLPQEALPPEIHFPSIHLPHHHHHAWELDRVISGHCGQSLPTLATTTRGVCPMKPLRRQARNVDERDPDA